MTEKKKPIPEDGARADDIWRLLEERVTWHEERKRERLAREERRRRRLHRLSLGLLGR